MSAAPATTRAVTAPVRPLGKRPRFVGFYGVCPVLRASGSEIDAHFRSKSEGKPIDQDEQRFWVRLHGFLFAVPASVVLDAPVLHKCPVSVRLLRLAREAVSKGRDA